MIIVVLRDADLFPRMGDNKDQLSEPGRLSSRALIMEDMQAMYDTSRQTSDPLKMFSDELKRRKCFPGP